MDNVELVTAWIYRRLGSTEKNIPAENVQALLSDMHLYPPQAKVGGMLECAKEVGERGTRSPHLTYGDYYNLASQLKRSRGNSRNIGRVLDRNGQEKRRRPRKMSKRNVGRDVFLGGSCNPTTWRQDVAIPLLESFGITYFNPQVAEWTADLVAVENNAKESASILFFFFDRRTRNVVGIIEVANYAGSRRDVVLVTDPYQAGEPVAGENISHEEYEELCSGLSTLEDLVGRQGILVYSNITEAIKSTAKILNNNQATPRNKQLKVVNGHGQSKEDPLKKKSDQSGRGGIVGLACYQLMLSTNNKTLTDLNGISSKSESADGIKISFGKLCTAVHSTTQIQGLCCNRSSYNSTSGCDLYIGGSCFDYEWKESIALPILSQNQLRYTFAECGSVKNSRASCQEAEVMENSKVLLFIITSKTRGLETMALASYFIGCGKNVVLCIQSLPENAVIGNEKLSKVAVNDYNRGRVYLSDVAIRSGIKVHKSVEDAVQEAVSKCNVSPTTSR